MAQITEHTGTLDDQPAFWLRGEPDAGAAPVLYVHGVPTSSEDWRPFLARSGGIAPDLPGFGRAGKRGDLPCTFAWYADWVERFLDTQGIDRFGLVVHDWGALALIAAQRLAERVDRVVVLNAAPLLPGYRWHRLARAWRTPLVGEVAIGLTVKPVLRRVLPAALVDDAARFLDVGTQRAILKLYRSAPEAELAAAGAHLDRLTCPALVVWGQRDRYIPASFGSAYAEALGGDVQLVALPDAGHWPWLDRPDVVDTVAAFLAA